MSEPAAPPSRRFQPIPIEETTKKVRKFTPEQDNDRSTAANDSAAVERQDFAKKPRHFLPTPIETTFKSSKNSANALPTPEPTPVSTSIPRSPPPGETPKPRRKFAPQLIETSKRSKRAGDPTPATLPTDKVRIGPTDGSVFNPSSSLNNSTAILTDSA